MSAATHVTVFGLAVALLASACAPTPGRQVSSAGGPRATPAAPPRASAPRIRPEDTAGLYWLPYETCHDCERPITLAAHLTTLPDEARRIMVALDGKLGLGLPYAIHTDELGLEPRQIAVVTGNFSSRAAATAAAASTSAIAGHEASLIDVAVDEYGYPINVPDAPRHVSVVDRGRPVRAWSQRDVDAALAAVDAAPDDGRDASPAARRARIRRALQGHRPACTLEPGSLFVIEDHELTGYELAPVRCGRQPAFVEWTSSLLGHAVIVPDRSGHRLRQIVGAQCDAPIIEDWRYDHDGREPDEPETGEPPLLAMGGC